MGNIIIPDLTCFYCNHTGNDYRIDERNGHQCCFCGKCGRFIKNLAKSNKYGTKEQQDEIWKKTRGRCAYCGDLLNPFERNGYTYDHIESQNSGGGNETENLFPACRSCNSQKNKKTLKEYRQYLAQKIGTPTHIFYFEVLQYSKIGELLSKMF